MRGVECGTHFPREHLLLLLAHFPVVLRMEQTAGSRGASALRDPSVKSPGYTAAFPHAGELRNTHVYMIYDVLLSMAFYFFKEVY